MNNWAKKSDIYWCCALWDVEYIDDQWWASSAMSDNHFEHGPFDTAKAAKAWCDEMTEANPDVGRL